MKTTQSFKRFIVTLLLGIFFQTNILVLGVSADSNDAKIVYPIQQISELECRFEKFSDLSSKCKRSLPILNTKDYEKYAKQGGWYNDFTRIYTVLWGSSYKYGWDIGFGGHQGVDIATAEGTPVYAMTDGKVIIAKKMLGWGNNVSVEHNIDGKKIVSNYSHLNKIQARVGQSVRAGEQIGTVWNTGNSFGNHLHFQIDLDTPFHPYYYDSKTCPYSYNQITEQWVCFDDLQANTLDPLAFLESNGAILDSIPSTTPVLANNTTTQRSTNSNVDIFDKTVYIDYASSDVKEVQQIFKDLGYYTGNIDGDYNQVLSSVVDYQMNSWVIATRSEDGAGWFWPKTRAQTRIDYNTYLATSGKSSSVAAVVVQEPQPAAVTKTPIKKIARVNLLTREQIEAKELDEFMSDHTIEVKLNEVGGNIQLNQTSLLKVDVKTSKGRSYKWNLPATMTFELDESIVSVFPKNLYNFNREARNIKLTGLKNGNTSLKVKIGSKVIQTIELKVYQSGETLYPKTGKIYGWNSIVVWETKTALAIMRDAAGKRLINIPYGSSYTLKTNSDAQVCIKTGSIENIKKVYKAKCDEADFTNEASFSYADTTGWVLVFDYKASWDNPELSIINDHDKSSLSTKNLAVRTPKGLNAQYAYHEEVIDLLEQWVVWGINQWYFLETRWLSKKDAVAWIENSLDIIDANTTDQQIKDDIANHRERLKDESRGGLSTTRQEFLTLAYDYLIFDKTQTGTAINYRDLNDAEDSIANIVFDSDETWRDAFGDNYYRPRVSITRWEAAFLLSQALRKTQDGALASN